MVTQLPTVNTAWFVMFLDWKRAFRLFLQRFLVGVV